MLESRTLASALAMVFFAVLRLLAGLGAALVAWVNLLGVPMMEARLMNPVVGWCAVGVVVCAVGPFWRVRSELGLVP